MLQQFHRCLIVAHFFSFQSNDVFYVLRNKWKFSYSYSFSSTKQQSTIDRSIMCQYTDLQRKISTNFSFHVHTLIVIHIISIYWNQIRRFHMSNQFIAFTCMTNMCFSFFSSYIIKVNLEINSIFYCTLKECIPLFMSSLVWHYLK